jgi:hypothetical protein
MEMEMELVHLLMMLIMYSGGNLKMYLVCN